MSHPKPFKVRIRWGLQCFGDGQEPMQYEFSTLEELNAFLYGVDEASGWLDYTQIDPNPDGTWPETPVETMETAEER